MKPVVLDSSAILPLFLPDESDVYSQAVIQQAAETRLLSLSLCLLEVGNTLTVAVRRNRMTEAQAAFAHHNLFSLPIEFRDFINGTTITLVHGIAQRRGLTFYDAAYLAFAMSEGAKLASLDRALISAAKLEGVEVV